MAEEPRAAPFKERLLATLLDWLPVALILSPFALTHHKPPPPVVLLLLGFLFYNGVYRTALYGQSLGKHLRGLHTVRWNGGLPGWGRAFARQLLGVALVVLSLQTKGLAAIFFLWALWDRRGQALHDKLTGTYVVTHRPAYAGPLPPDLLAGKYAVVRPIGEGGMGEVFEALHTQLNRKVALKKMRQELRKNPREKTRFLKEARTVAEMRHPSIIEIYDILEEGEDLYLVFEYMEGKTVAQILDARGRIPIREALRIAQPVCDALEYAHGRRVVHRDLKPSNVMVSEGGRFEAKVMDFGIAREAKDTLSRVGSMRDTSGTLAYMSPEQHLGMSKPASDIYSLGVTFYEMITGELPFQGPDFLAQKERMIYRPASQVQPGLPKELDAVLSLCFQAKKELRMPTAAKLWEYLKSVPA